MRENRKGKIDEVAENGGKRVLALGFIQNAFVLYFMLHGYV